MSKRSRKRRKTVTRRPTAIAFLSHAAADRRFVERLAHLLRIHGVRVWYSSEHLRGAQQWHDHIGAALRRCRWFVVVVSPRAVKSRWVKRELLYALDDPRYEERIVPVLYRPAEIERLSWVLRAFQRVDFTRDFEDGARALLKIWRKEYRASSKRRR